MFPSVFELDSRSDDQVLHGAGHEDFARTGESTHPGSYVDGKATKVIVSDFAFSRVKARAELEAEAIGRFHDCPPTADCAGWTIE